MNNQEKSKLDIVSGDSVVIEQSPVIEVEPEKLEIFQGASLAVLIKHDYYSSDSAHGRELLGAFLKALSSKKDIIDRIFVIDSGVKLLTAGNSLYNEFITLIKEIPVVTACAESIEEYGADDAGLPANCEVLGISDIAKTLIDTQGLITLE